MKKSQETRLHILQTAFQLIYGKGYQTTSVDEIIAQTKVTKGAFYYHFKTKDEMGLAILNELLRPTFTDHFISPLENSENALESIYDLLYKILMEDSFMTVENGCPASNFTQEMAPWNAEFTQTLNELSKDWELAMIQAIEKSKEKGLVRTEVNAEEVAVFVLSGYWGVRNLGKLENSKGVYKVFLKGLTSYFNSLG
ncbi:TetR/AcrR family transcriptional repressor of nem operon [Chryseobacterium sp. SORGH_AS 447]|uniref:TetR/AcrR family transcriptional regulator n=1 Tax=Chryseobacterium sp. SORGH_AS_0447 TaxID=3041769 RepID=UPI00277D8074|nr:TetR/AcrR family transcriptional regulator [Chryseobacterium sp. SORGH_AS_0447]MDQ1162561.1 TetR/AcrR family transcriptional repressor of nem operon [Chryseobacterium sp. SORGH_AS_0447]